MANCYLSQKAIDSACHFHSSDAAFMGRTHVTSAVAIFLASVAFLPTFTEKLLGTDNLWIVIMAAIVMAGASLIPDFDNTSSTARNSLGPVGFIASEGIRMGSTAIQMFIRSSKDDATPNPHRGAAHTIPFAALIGFGTIALTKLGGSVTLPIIGKTDWGGVAAIIIVFIMCHLALSGLFKPFMKKLGKSSPLGELVSFAFSFAISFAIYSQAPPHQSFWWLGIAMTSGCIIHIIGDAFTTAGVPLLWPLKYKGKRWWMVRFTSIKAGGVVENVLFVPAFLLLILLAGLRILGVF